MAQFLRGEVTSAGGEAQFSEGTEAFDEGTVGWATTRLTISLPDGRHVSPRWSAVFYREDDTWRFVREDDTWRFVHTHASIGVANDDIGWVYPD